ncbi:hypothetical protein CR203_06300 [Salipaludibacillus neizhouensis]|uniref:Serine kinase n=1 Tax=Salipaludibacillus neizhouensis TaxID=885475 RepID=A0A3A9KEP1_9BACI|nr:four-carbon acid sugar kinase family protein [Salipaludibacillus neizhouensis]RKL68103.1 hypothetical protein CR203_06300 [Salipaludibacillus neizhouensis]
MKIAIIADDLTGANDTGVQFAKKGWKTSVLMQENQKIEEDIEVFVIDTDSRASSPNEAYKNVRNAINVVEKNSVDILYKKIDSTMRGNIGVELDAIYDHYPADFILIAPGYPKNNRFVKEGTLIIGDVPLHESEFSNDLKTPIGLSYIPDIIKKSSVKDVGIISESDLVNNESDIFSKLSNYHDKNIPYLVCDSMEEYHLEKLVDFIGETEYNVVWCGSAGLANYLSENKETLNNEEISINEYLDPILMVIGSLHDITREQLNYLLNDSTITGIKLNSHLVVGSEEELNSETQRVISEITTAFENKKNVALFSSGSKAEIEQSITNGKKYKMDAVQVSDRISKVLGEITNKVFKETEINKLFLTGGDTAKKVCTCLDITEFILLNEVETGVPIGVLRGEGPILTITKAGGFGSLEALHNSYKLFGGGKKCAQLLE